MNSKVVMDRDQIWQVIDAQRTSLADLLEDLSDEEWQQPSLCAGWTVRDVAAHLTLQQLGFGGLIATMTRWRGSFDRTIHYAACRRARAPSTERIITEVRAMVGSRRHTVGVTQLETHTDILVHTQDIAIPLGCRHDMPPAAVAASRVLSMRWTPPLPSARKVVGFRLTATDTPLVRRRRSGGPRPDERAPAGLRRTPRRCRDCPVTAPPTSGPASRHPPRHDLGHDRRNDDRDIGGTGIHAPSRRVQPGPEPNCPTGTDRDRPELSAVAR